MHGNGAESGNGDDDVPPDVIRDDIDNVSAVASAGWFAAYPCAPCNMEPLTLSSPPHAFVQFA